MVGIDEELLLSVLRQEEMDSATFYASEIAREQATATDRFFARPYGDGSEVPNRSQVCTRDIQDAINWVMPDLKRPFLAEDAISCDDDAIDADDETLADAARYLRHVWFKDNPGARNLHDFLFDGLTVKIGVLRSSWQPAEPKPPEIIEGLLYEQVLRYANDPRYNILAAAQDGELQGDPGPEPDGDETPAQPQLPSPAGGNRGLMAGLPGGEATQGLMAAPAAPQPPPQVIGPEPTFSIQVQRIRTGSVSVEVIPPEEFRLARRARSIETAPYHGWRFEAYMADLKRQHPDKVKELDDEGLAEVAVGLDAFYDERLTARFPDELDNGVNRIAKEPERRKVVCHIEYIRGDFDGDGVVELRRIKRSGGVLLENDIAEESEFTMWSPIPVSHRAIGISLADTLIDIQKIRTVLTRKAMDSLSQSLAPRTAVSAEAAQRDPSLIDRLLDHDVGDVIPVSGDPSKILMPLTTPDVSASAFQAIEYWDRRSEEASGVNRHAMGIQPQAITDTKGGIENLQAAANKRVEDYAVWAGIALEEAFGKILRLLIAHQDQPRIVKINGRRLSIDPRRWSDEMTVSVHVGSVEDRARKLQILNLIAGKQEQILLQAGPGNPMVGFSEYRNTLARMVIASGEKSAAPYFKEIPDNWQPPPPQPDPKTQAMQAKLQMDQAKAASDAQLKQQQFAHDKALSEAKLQADAEASEREARSKHELQAIQIDADAKLAQAKAAAEAALAQQRIDAEMALARERMAAELELARWKEAQAVKLQRQKIASMPQVTMQSGAQKGMNGTGSGMRFGGRVG